MYWVEVRNVRARKPVTIDRRVLGAGRKMRIPHEIYQQQYVQRMQKLGRIKVVASHLPADESAPAQAAPAPAPQPPAAAPAPLEEPPAAPVSAQPPETAPEPEEADSAPPEEEEPAGPVTVEDDVVLGSPPSVGAPAARRWTQDELEAKTLPELRPLYTRLTGESSSNVRKADIVDGILAAQEA